MGKNNKKRSEKSIERGLELSRLQAQRRLNNVESVNNFSPLQQQVYAHKRPSKQLRALRRMNDPRVQERSRIEADKRAIEAAKVKAALADRQRQASESARKAMGHS
jgi:hypothetical protein